MSSGSLMAPKVAAYADLLGETVERLWEPHRHHEARFPEVAAQALTEVAVPPGVDARTILGYLTSTSRLPVQERGGFGQPPVTLYRSRHFYISALYWLDGTTAIHQHGFSGAFQVLEGSSIHVAYDFSCQEEVTRRFMFGDLRRGTVEVLRRGDIRPIEAGGEFIHALFHLDRPSVTVVVRTFSESTGVPQFSYHRPGVAYDPFFEDKGLARRLQGIDTLWAIAPDEAPRYAMDLVSSSDLFGAFSVAHHWFVALERGEPFHEILEHLIRHHGSVAAPLRLVFDDLGREISIVLRRKLVHDPSHRLFLAMLLNLPDRAAVDAIVRELFPNQEPGQVLATWVRELAAPAMRGVSGLQVTDDELEALCVNLRDQAPESQSSAGLRTLASGIRPPPLLEQLFTSSTSR